jgi:hypothetical protein
MKMAFYLAAVLVILVIASGWLAERRRDKLREAILVQLDRQNVMSTRELWERLQSSCGIGALHEEVTAMEQCELVHTFHDLSSSNLFGHGSRIVTLVLDSSRY